MDVFQAMELIVLDQFIFVRDLISFFGILVDHPGELMPVSPHVTVKPEKQDKLSFDEVRRF